MERSDTIQTVLNQQQAFYASGATRDLAFRRRNLKKLETVLSQNESLIFDTLRDEFRKPPFETYATELGVIYQDIGLHHRKLRSWSKPQRVGGSIVNFPSSNYIYKVPYGTVLIFGSWNYPILLSLQPVVSALSAGNTVVLKPSEQAPRSSSLLYKLVRSSFPPELFTVIEGGVNTGRELLEQNFDYIFFTGSTAVGKEVMRKAAETLTPVTLELGGKSPAIVDSTADIEVAAKRIAWGKFVNAGQTCVAPDYVMAHKSVCSGLLQKLVTSISDLYGDSPRQSPDYARIINRDHFDRLTGLLEEGTTVTGGKYDPETLFIAPTVITDITWEDSVMQEEIFGPILPVLTYENPDQVIRQINQRPTPLSLYLFSSDRSMTDRIIREVEFGGGAVNDTLAYLGNARLPFGGKGESGIGAYHGKAGFDTFSHRKSVMKKPAWPDIPIRYAPYRDKLKWVKKIF